MSDHTNLLGPETWSVPGIPPSHIGGSYARRGWWSNDNSPGTNVEKPFPSSAGQLVTIAGIDGLGPPMPQTVTLHGRFSYAGSANCCARAVVEMGAGAVTKRIVCDWLPGTQIAIAAAGALRVALLTEASDPDSPYVADGCTFDVGASFGVTAGPHPQPRYTQRRLNIATAATATFEPPQWAESVCIVATLPSEAPTDPYAALALRWIAPAGQVIGQVFGPAIAGVNFAPAPLGARLNVANNSGDGSARNVAVMWRLAL